MRRTVLTLVAPLLLAAGCQETAEVGAEPPPHALTAAGTARTAAESWVRGAASVLPAESSGPAAFALLREDPAGPTPVAGAERILAAAPLSRGRVVWVVDRGGAGDLVLADGAERSLLDREALPELAVSPDGERLLYPRRAGALHELVLAEPASGRRKVVYAGPTADRPVFRDDGEGYAFVGTGDGGLAALFTAESGGEARQVTNRGLRAGRGLPPGFVPPPHSAEAMSFSGDRVRYATPDGACEVDVRSGTAACGKGVRP